MVVASLSGACCHQQMICNSLCCSVLRYGVDRNVDEKFKNLTDLTTSVGVIKHKKRRLSLSPMAAAAPVKTGGSSSPEFYKEVSDVSGIKLYVSWDCVQVSAILPTILPRFLKVLTAARAIFTQEISFQLKDKDISLAKTLLHISAEDEAFIAFNREMDASSFQNEREGSKPSSDGQYLSQRESMLLAGKKLEDWLSELDAIAKEVEVELISRDIGCHMIEVLEAVNKVLFDSMGFKRSNIMESKCSYLHSVLSSKCGSAILLSIIYIEVCKRLNLTIVGSRVGEDFLIWPQTGNPEELFKVTSGHSLFGIVNGRCVEDPKSKASDINSSSLMGLDIATNRDIIGIYLANLIRLHWKRASRLNRGLMLTSPLRPVHADKTDGSSIPLLRPQDLRLAIMASEKLLILQPHNWALRRDHGMMLYFTREYGEAVQELSICMAFAPEEEAEILEPFVEKLHLLRLESSWKSLGHKGRLTVP